jgi:hypothetical protein
LYDKLFNFVSQHRPFQSGRIQHAVCRHLDVPPRTSPSTRSPDEVDA